MINVLILDIIERINKMLNNEILKEWLNEIGIYVEEDNKKIKGHSCNIKQYPVFRIWINKSRKVTIKTRGVQKSFYINEKSSLKNELIGFQII